MGGDLGIVTQVKSIERYGYHDSIISKFKCLLSIFMDNSGNSTTTSLTDMKLKKDFRQFFVYWNGDTGKESRFRLPWGLRSE